MKFYTFISLVCVIVISTLILTACDNAPPQPALPYGPTPFTTGPTVQPMSGCLFMRTWATQYSKQHPKNPMAADC